jgi:hypothetical protein
MASDAEKEAVAQHLRLAFALRNKARKSIVETERVLDDALRQFERAWGMDPITLTGMEAYAEHTGNASLAPSYFDVRRDQ